MIQKEYFSDGAGYDPIMVDLAHKAMAGGLEPEKFTARILGEESTNPDEKSLQTARRIEALGCNVDFRRRGKRDNVFYGSAAKSAKGSGGSKHRGGPKRS